MLDRLRRVAGSEAVRREPGGVARVTPPTTEAVAGILGMAHDEGWRVAVEGGSTWRAEDAPADVVLTLRGLDTPAPMRSGDQEITAGAGLSLDRLRRESLDQGGWIALDPPGRPDRTIGSIVATATAGPLRHGFGAVRDQVAGLTVVAGDGRVLKLDAAAPSPGETIRPHVGGFGAFGVITACRIRVRALPRADTTWVTSGSRDALTDEARQLGDAGVAGALELFSPALAMTREWLLGIRLLGELDDVIAAGRRLGAQGRLNWRELPPGGLWSVAARAVISVPVTLRLGVLPAGIDDTIDLVSARLGEGMLSTAPASGGLRWSGVADAESIRDLRRELVAREIPLTVERAPWRVRRAVGHLGAYREAGGGSAEQLRTRFDPAGVLVTALHAGQEA